MNQVATHRKTPKPLPDGMRSIGEIVAKLVRDLDGTRK